MRRALAADLPVLLHQLLAQGLLDMTARRLQRLDLALQLGLAPDRLVAHLAQRGQFALERLQPRLMLVRPVVLLSPALALVRIEMRTRCRVSRCMPPAPASSSPIAVASPPSPCHSAIASMSPLASRKVTKRNKLNDARGLAEHLEESLSITCRHPALQAEHKDRSALGCYLAGIAFNRKPPEP